MTIAVDMGRKATKTKTNKVSILSIIKKETYISHCIQAVKMYNRIQSVQHIVFNGHLFSKNFIKNVFLKLTSVNSLQHMEIMY